MQTSLAGAKVGNVSLEERTAQEERELKLIEDKLKFDSQHNVGLQNTLGLETLMISQTTGTLL